MRKHRRAGLYAEGVVLLLVGAVVLMLVYKQFRGDFTPKTELTMVASRAGLVMEPGSKVTYNGVAIGRVASISELQSDGKPAAKLMLNVDPKYIKLIPQNVSASIEASHPVRQQVRVAHRAGRPQAATDLVARRDRRAHR